LAEVKTLAEQSKSIRCSRRSFTIPRQTSSMTSGRRMSTEARKKGTGECAVYVVCSPADALNHARVLRSELEIRLGRACAVGGDSDAANRIPVCDIVVVLLTKKLPVGPEALLEIWKALDNGRTIVTVSVTGGGYDYSEAAKTYSNLTSALNSARPNGAAEMAKHLHSSLDVDAVGAKLHADLTSIIAIAWSPHASRNQTLAVVNDICSRMFKAKLQLAVQRTMSAERAERKRSVFLQEPERKRSVFLQERKRSVFLQRIGDLMLNDRRTEMEPKDNGNTEVTGISSAV